MRINANMSALNTHRQLSANQVNTGRSVERLSSGLRINRAGDDAAGLAISEQMRGQVRGLTQATRNAQDGISLIQTAEGALNETHSILQRMRELAVQGANDTLVPGDRNAIGVELLQLRDEITRIATTTQFNGQTLLNGTFGVRVYEANALNTLDVGSAGVTGVNVSGAQATTTYTLAVLGTAVTLSDAAGNAQVIDAVSATFTGTLNFDNLGVAITLSDAPLAGINGRAVVTTDYAAQNLQIGANSNQRLGVSINDMSATGLVVDNLTVTNHVNAENAINSITTAIASVSTERSTLGAWQNRLEHTINNLGTSAENLTAAESRIRDVDMAQEMMEFTRNNILSQAAQAMLAQANQLPQGVLQLLR